MAVIETTARAPMGAISVYKIVSALESVVIAARNWRDAERTYTQLSSLSREQLDDIGLDGVDLRRLGADLARRR